MTFWYYSVKIVLKKSVKKRAAGWVNKVGFNRNLHAVIIGGANDDFVCFTKSVFGDYEIEFVLCEDIYAAIGYLAKSMQDNVLVIGRYEQLSGEGGRFFEKINEKGFYCCCLLNRDSEQKQIDTTKNNSVFIVNECDEISRVIVELLPSSLSQGAQEKKSSGSEARGIFDKNKFSPTDAERDALLEGMNQ